MAKRSQRKGTPSAKGETRTPASEKITTRPRWLYEAAAVVALYLVTLMLFWGYVVQDTRFSAGGDAAAARAWNSVGDEIAQTEDVTPLWNPYVFLGFPTFGSLTYHTGTWLNPVDDIAAVGKYLFGVEPLNRQVFFYFLSGLAMYLFARGVGVPIWGALLAGLAFLLNPYNISLAEAGHGSKQWTIALMPLVLLMTHRVLTRRNLLAIGLLALALASQFLELHVQIVYYTLLMAGGYVLVWFIAKLIRERATALKGLGAFAVGSGLGLGMAFYVYWPVYVFQKFSIRGAPPLREAASATGGLDWTYATNWSLHPLETLQFLFPGFYGLGGSLSPDRAMTPDNILNYNLYWGWMPFTQSSLYMGIIPLVLAIVAVVLLWRKRGLVQWLAIASILAIVVAFGRFFPILYGPMYHLLPFFAKFRVPSMSLVVTAAGVAVLAGIGLREIVLKIREAREDSAVAKKWARFFYILTAISLVALFAGLGGKGGAPWFNGFLKEGELARYGQQTASMLVKLRWDIFTASLTQTSLYLLIFSLLGVAAFKLKGSVRTLATVFAAGAVLLTAWDLGVLGGRFLHPVPARGLERALAETPAMKYLKEQLDQSEEPFRIFPLGGEFQSNSWMYHRIPSIGGYAAVKLRVYQDMLDYALNIDKPNSIPNLKVAGMMNAKYLVVPGRLPADFPVAFEDPQGKQMVYHNPAAQPHAWFVGMVRYQPDLNKVMDAISSEEFDPGMEAYVSDKPDFQVGNPDSVGTAVVPSDKYTSRTFEIDVDTPDRGFLVVSEIWYPQGWSATIDGEPTTIYRTNYGLRGVAVPPGKHTIRMAYNPPEVRWGFTISILSLILVLALIGGHFALARRGMMPAADKLSSDDAE